MSILAIMRKGFCGRKVYPALNPSRTGSSASLSNSNLTVNCSSSSCSSGVIGRSIQKRYFEVYVNSCTSWANIGVGDSTVNVETYPASGSVTYQSNGTLRYGAANGYSLGSYGAGSVIGVAVDAGALTMDLYLNNSLQMSGISISGFGVGSPIYPILGGGNCVLTFRPDPANMSYSAPSGYTAGWD